MNSGALGGIFRNPNVHVSILKNYFPVKEISPFEKRLVLVLNLRKYKVSLEHFEPKKKKKGTEGRKEDQSRVS